MTRAGTATLVAALLLGPAALAGCGSEPDVTVGLITKQEENPYWVTMRDVAQRAADREGVELVTATGESDVDVAGQEAALAEMVGAGVDGILIAPTDSEALVPAIEAARETGITVIAVDTPTEPMSAVDAFYGTDNLAAGELVGRYARSAVEGVSDPQVALLDLAPGIASGEQRLEGFLAGFGIDADDPAVVGQVETQGDEELARAGMAELLEQAPGIDVVYTVNEPAAFGALAALDEAGVAPGDVVVVSVDGGCRAVKDYVRTGRIDATAQQYPQNMAREGVEAVVEQARGGAEPSGYLATGVQLITDDPVADVPSEDVPFGVRNCWG